MEIKDTNSGVANKAVIVIIQVKNDGELDQDDSSDLAIRWTDFKYILKSNQENNYYISIFIVYKLEIYISIIYMHVYLSS